jgi:prepilin-type N-terminal cleavage/methylation domain-containing protein
MTLSRSSRGFTLTELVLVVVVLGVLAATALPIYFDWRAQAERTAIERAVGVLSSARQAFHAKALVNNVNAYASPSNITLATVLALSGSSTPVECDGSYGYCTGHPADRSAFGNIAADPGADLFLDNPNQGNNIQIITRSGRTVSIMLNPATGAITWSASPAF